jgi:hypothetical protein
MTGAVEEDLSFKAAMKELDEIVGRLEMGSDGKITTAPFDAEPAGGP